MIWNYFLENGKVRGWASTLINEVRTENGNFTNGCMPSDIASDYNNHTAEKDFREPRKLNVTLLTGFKNIKHKSKHIKQNKQVVVYCRSYNKVLPTIY